RNAGEKIAECFLSSKADCQRDNAGGRQPASGIDIPGNENEIDSQREEENVGGNLKERSGCWLERLEAGWVGRQPFQEGGGYAKQKHQPDNDENRLQNIEAD